MLIFDYKMIILLTSRLLSLFGKVALGLGCEYKSTRGNLWDCTNGTL